MLQCVAAYQGYVVLGFLHGVSAFCIPSVLQCVAARCSVLHVVQQFIRGTSSFAFYMVSLHSVYAACCSVQQCVAVRHSAVQCVSVCFSVLQCVAVRCSVSKARRPWGFLWRLCICICSELQCIAVRCSSLYCVAICQGHVVLCFFHSVSAFCICSVLKCVAVRCSALQCISVRCSVSEERRP